MFEGVNYLFLKWIGPVLCVNQSAATAAQPKVYL